MTETVVETVETVKKKGRPKGSKNRPKKILLAEKKAKEKKQKRKKGGRKNRKNKELVKSTTSSGVVSQKSKKQETNSKVNLERTGGQTFQPQIIVEWFPGLRVQTDPGNFGCTKIYTGTVVRTCPDKPWAWVEWDDGSKQYAAKANLRTTGKKTLKQRVEGYFQETVTKEEESE